MRFKKGVKIKGIQPETILALVVADEVYKERGRPEGVTVTSISDGKHMTGSKHYTGHGADLRTYYFHPDIQLEIVDMLRHRLTDEYDVALEEDHIHLEFDPK